MNEKYHHYYIFISIIFALSEVLSVMNTSTKMYKYMRENN